MMSPRQIAPAILATIIVALSACGGGGGSAASSPTGIVPSPLSTQRLGVSLTPSSGSVFPFSTSRHSLAATTAAGQNVTVTYNGATVASGSLDGNGFVELTFTQSVPAGSTVTVTTGSGATAVVASVTLSQALSATASDIVYSAGPPPTITVKTSDDPSGDGQVSSSDGNQTTDTENPSNGEVEDVNSSTSVTLPSNLPVTITSCATTITITPVASMGALGLQFEEKTSDGSGSAQYEYAANPFSAALTFPILSSAARVDMTITQNGTTLVTIEAPLSALLTTAPTGASPSPSPSACPTLSPNVPT